MTESNHSQDDMSNATQKVQNQLPVIATLNQYIKDFSFENPNAPISYMWLREAMPEISMNLNVNALNTTEAGIFEVQLKMGLTARIPQGVVFVIDLCYAGIFKITNVTPALLEYVLYVECSRMIYPFVRSIISSSIQDASYPVLHLEMIDFNKLYMEQNAVRAQAQQPTDQRIAS